MLHLSNVNVSPVREGMKHAVCVLLFPLVIVYLAQAVTLQSFPAALSWMGAHVPAVLMSIVPLAAVQLFLRALLGGYALSTALCAFFFLAAALVDHYKTVINGFPLMLCDFSLLESAGDIVAYAVPKLTLSTTTVLTLVLAFVLVLFAGTALRSRVVRSLRASFLMLALSLPLLLFCVAPGALQDAAASLTEGCASQEERRERCGVVCGLYSAWCAGNSTDYSAYSAETVGELQNTLYLTRQTQNEETSSVRPHILLILSESFFDVTRLENVEFSEDPLPNFHRLCQSSTNGSFLSSAYAGGTGIVELETLTGFADHLLKEADSLTALTRKDADVYESLPSIARDLRADGYETFYIHGHNASLYRRTETMPALGFDSVIFSDDFETPVSFDGGYLSDDTLVNEILYRFENRAGDSPVFMQITSMENHQPYTAEKYPGIASLLSESPLTEDERAVLDAYVTGLQHADAALGRLVDYFSQLDEPVMLVLYGDHRPSLMLSDDATVYSAIGQVSTADSLQWTSEELCEMLSTDYLIWTNYEAEPEPDHLESSHFLGADILRRAGLRRCTYFDWLIEEAGESYLLTRPRLFVSAGGIALRDVSEEAAPLLDAQRMMQYDMVYGEQYLSSYFRLDT